jgi:hypothetical protein
VWRSHDHPDELGYRPLAPEAIVPTDQRPIMH